MDLLVQFYLIVSIQGPQTRATPIGHLVGGARIAARSRAAPGPQLAGVQEDPEADVDDREAGLQSSVRCLGGPVRRDQGAEGGTAGTSRRLRGPRGRRKPRLRGGRRRHALQRRRARPRKCRRRPILPSAGPEGVSVAAAERARAWPNVHDPVRRQTSATGRDERTGWKRDRGRLGAGVLDGRTNREVAVVQQEAESARSEERRVGKE